eukprot:TRINITY_DN43129_c0_g1_i1.p1 TRINITY_DN43129_c0_g1~~TRINITY_DN43129_c0_g1_i1.p1  ORF type:complete len:347 (-),score=84.96 TRINITY_DN43129_c0_g1_i1:277-1206(-)
MLRSLVGSEMCIRDSINAEYGGCQTGSMTDEPEPKRGCKEQEWMPVLDALQTTVHGLQGTLATAMRDSATKLNTSVQMMESMNNLMEEYLARSVVLETLVLPSSQGDGGFGVRVKLRNNCQFGLERLTLVLEARMQGEPVPVDFGVPAIDKFKGEFELAAAEMIQEDVLCSCKADPVHAFDVHVRADFPSPGTGKTLSARTICPVRFLDLCGIPELSIQEALPNQTVDRAMIPLEFLRGWLRVSPADAFPFNARFELQLPLTAAKAYLEVGSKTDNNLVAVGFQVSDTPGTADQLTQDLVSKCGEKVGT